MSRTTQLNTRPLNTTKLSTLFLILVLLTLPASASPQDDGWQLRLSGILLEPDVTFIDLNSNGNRIAAGADNAVGFGFNLERRFSSRLGVEVGGMFAEPDLTLDANLGDGFQFNTSAGVSFTAVTAGLNIHLTPNRAVDLYVGPLFAYVFFGDVNIRTQNSGVVLAQDFTSEDDFALGAQIGADFSFGNSPWSLNLAAKVLDSNLEVIGDDGEKNDLGFEPLILSVGFGYRF